MLYVFFMGQTHLPGGGRQKGRKMEEPRGIQGCLPLEHLDNLIWLLLRFAMDNLMPCTLLHSLNILEMI